MDQHAEKTTNFEGDQKPPEQNHLLGDTGFTIQTADSAKFVDGKAYIEKDAKGQYFEKKDLEELGKDITDYLQKVAQDTSKANNGAEINVAAGVAAAYIPHHQYMDTGIVARATAGSGELGSDPPALPDQKELEQSIKSIVQKFEKDMKGEWNATWPALSIIGDLGIRGDNKYTPLLAEAKVEDNQAKPKK